MHFKQKHIFLGLQNILKDKIASTDFLSYSDPFSENLQDLIENTLFLVGPGTIVSYTGLLMIKQLITNIDIYLYLETSYKILDKLNILQNECLVPDDDDNDNNNKKKDNTKNTEYIIDEASLLREEIISRISTMGSITYKTSCTFKKSSSGAITGSKKLSDMQKFLKETKQNLHDNNWILQVRRVFKGSLDEPVKEMVLVELLRQVKQHYMVAENEFHWPAQDAELRDLFPEEVLGISVVIKWVLWF